MDEDNTKSMVQIPLNKLGQYFESDDTNATLSITAKGIIVTGALDGGARVSLISKKCWKKVGESHLEVSDIVVKMANGTTPKPIRMLRDLMIKVLKHRVKHTFII